MARKKEEKFEKIVNWNWGNDTSFTLLFMLISFAFGCVVTWQKSIGAIIGYTTLNIILMFTIGGFPERKVYWKRIR